MGEIVQDHRWEKELKGIYEMLGGAKMLIEVTIAEGAQEGQSGLSQRESEDGLLSKNPQGPSS